MRAFSKCGGRVRCALSNGKNNRIRLSVRACLKQKRRQSKVQIEQRRKQVYVRYNKTESMQCADVPAMTSAISKGVPETGMPEGAPSASTFVTAEPEPVNCNKARHDTSEVSWK